MRVLLLGVGMQGRAALHDLAGGPEPADVVAADRHAAELERYVSARGYARAVRCECVDAGDPAQLDRLLAGGFDVVIDLLPPSFLAAVASAAVRHGVHVVNTMYVTPELLAMAGEAASRGVAILPEFGMDPGIDLVLLGEAVREFDQVTDILSYGAGIPEPAAADNPLRYKVSWTFEGVLRSYRRAARLLEDGAEVAVSAEAQFQPEHVHEVEVAGVGRLEAYPNGDALGLVEGLGLDRAHLVNVGRYTMRYPGHSALWRTLVALGLLDDAPVVVDGAAVDRKRYLATALEPRLQYGSGERDLAIIRVEVAGTRAGRPARVVYEVMDRRDLATGLTAVSRLTGFTAAIGARMLASGEIGKRGLLSPLTDVPWASLARELARRGVVATRRA